MAIEFTLDDGSVIEFNSISNNKNIINEDPNVYTLDNFITKKIINILFNSKTAFKPSIGWCWFGS